MVKASGRIPFSTWRQLTGAVAMSLSPDVIGVHLSKLEDPNDEESHRTLQAQWKRDVQEPSRRAGLMPPRPMVLPAQYRARHEPVLKLARRRAAGKVRGTRIAVLIPELIKQRWYQTIVHTHRARRLRPQLLRHGGPSAATQS
jgi:hypothetical protein